MSYQLQVIFSNYFVSRIIFMVILFLIFKNISHKGLKFFVGLYMGLLALTILQTPLISLGYLIDPTASSPFSMILINMGVFFKSITVFSPFL